MPAPEPRAPGKRLFSAPVPAPQVLERNIVNFEKETVQIAFHISLPGSADNRILGRQATQMFAQELTGVVDTLNAWIAKTAQLKRHCDVIEDMVVLQNELAQYGLMAFVGDGAFLPRQSGVSQAPLKENGVAFYAPDQMAVEVDFKNTGRKRGLGIRPGSTCLSEAVFMVNPPYSMHWSKGSAGVAIRSGWCVGQPD